MQAHVATGFARSTYWRWWSISPSVAHYRLKSDVALPPACHEQTNVDYWPGTGVSIQDLQPVQVPKVVAGDKAGVGQSDEAGY